ncbi:efflux pump aflT [Rhypophila decipiens]
MTSQLETPGTKPAPVVGLEPPAASSSSRTVTLTNETDVRHDLESPVPSSPGEVLMPFWKGWGLWLAIVSSIACPFLDEGIIATAVSSITSDFGSLGDAGWYGSGYLMTMSAFQLIFGRLYSVFPTRPIFLGSLFLFEGGSLICALSPNSHVFIFGRSVAGIGAAGLYSGVMALFALLLPKYRLPIYVASMGTLYGVAAQTGPLLGGVITSSIGWRWCFWINLPVAIPGLVINLFFLKPPLRPRPAVAGKEGETSGKPAATVWARLAALDYLGMVLLIPGICCLLVAVDNGGTEGWADKTTIGCFVGAGLLIPSFALSQWWKGEAALLPPRIVTDRLVFSCCVFTLCVESCFMVMVYYMPMWFQTVQGVSAAESGIRYLAHSVSYCVVELACAGIVFKTGYVQPCMLLGSILIPIGGGLLSMSKVWSGPEHWATFQIIVGMGIGAATDQPGVVVQRLLGETDAPLGYATVLFCQNLGPTMALIIANSIFLGRLKTGIIDVFGDELDPEKVLSSGATEIRGMVAPEHVPKLLEIYNQSLTRVFMIVIAAAIVSMFAIIGLGTKRIPDDEVMARRDPERKGGQRDLNEKGREHPSASSEKKSGP